MNKFYIKKLGCDKNDVDADVMRGLLMKEGFIEIKDPELADFIIVNTCGFIKPAKEESIDAILTALDINESTKVYVTGCLAERYADELIEEMPEVTSFIGIGHFDQIVDIVNKKNPPKIYRNNKNIGKEFLARKIDEKPFAFVKIADGCNSKCSYCAIPSIKGSFQSRSIDSIIQEVKHLADQGVKEINLVAQNTTAYGLDLKPKTNIANLLKELIKIEEIKWFRLLYSYPGFITDELINLIANEEKIVSYLDIPIQHSHPKILQQMKRGAINLIKPEWFDNLRARIPNLSIRTTLIVGFPGETEEEFNHLLHFINEVQFDHLGVFVYSEEDNTPAADLDNKVDYEVAVQRMNIIVEEQKYIAYNQKKKWLNKKVDVIVEKRLSRSKYEIRSEMNAPDIDAHFYIDSAIDLTPGQIVKVVVTDIDFDALYGRVI
ncbi:MAG: 30S ribosomal protein S12 methylthiotransferase RimO [Clostridia bacterium]